MRKVKCKNNDLDIDIIKSKVNAALYEPSYFFDSHFHYPHSKTFFKTKSSLDCTHKNQHLK